MVFMYLEFAYRTRISQISVAEFPFSIDTIRKIYSNRIAENCKQLSLFTTLSLVLIFCLTLIFAILHIQKILWTCVHSSLLSKNYQYELFLTMGSLVTIQSNNGSKIFITQFQSFNSHTQTYLYHHMVTF